MTKYKKSAVIVNPHSGGGLTKRYWGDIRDEVNSRLKGVQEFKTAASGDATRFAKLIAQEGFDLLVVAGGDGTINEVVNGLMDENGQPINSNLKIGILSTGRGCDFIKSLGMPADFREALAAILDPNFRSVDVGKAAFKDEFGRPQIRFFVNSASAGLSGTVVQKVNKASRFLPPTLTYFSAAATSFLKASGQQLSVIIDNKVVFDGKVLTMFVANGAYSGSGMCWAPDSKLDDGLLDVVIAENMPKHRIVFSAHKLYDGTFRNLPEVHYYQGRDIVINTEDDVLLELDGEQPGVAPAHFVVCPRALTFITK